MEPILRDGDELLVSDIQSGNFKAGDILLYQSQEEGRRVAHRFVKCTGDEYLLRADFDLREEWVSRNYLVGKVYGYLRGSRFISFDHPGQRFLGWSIVFIYPFWTAVYRR